MSARTFKVQSQTCSVQYIFVSGSYYIFSEYRGYKRVAACDKRESVTKNNIKGT